ncbi:putative defense protein 3 [Orchesella cincta]|uniref:Putative defense protein 3 n=1 Tax=Orchesella cincta TaxID=48709 RepID=A0A1D2MVB3_ORCCI|nr:putative defense protein 3 [Orchesella cincta]
MQTFTVALALTLLCTISTVNAFGSGAPEGVCVSMLPGHRALPSPDTFPYKVVLSKQTVTSEESVDITITSLSGEREFKGFILQVRKAGEEKAYGEFKVDSGDETTQTLDCFETSRNAITHASNVPKKSVKVEWVAPEEEGVYEVLVTIVGKGYGEFWKPQTHGEKITVVSGEDEDAKARIEKARQGQQRSDSSQYSKKDNRSGQVISFNMKEADVAGI